MIDDAQLIRGFVDKKNTDAFASLVERHLALVYRTALRLNGGDAHGAEDIAQIVFTLLARKAASLRDFSSVAGWLYGATRRVAHDVRRREQRRKLREEGARIMEEIYGLGERQADWEALRPVLDDAMGELNAADREAILLRFFKDRAFAEIGATLRLSEDAARIRVGRALEKLRSLLERRGVKSTASALGLLLSGEAALGAPAGLSVTVTQGALAGAGTATALVGASAFGFMSTIKSVGAVAVIALTACVAVYEVRAKREAETELDSARKEYAALVAKTENAERAARMAEERLRENTVSTVVVPPKVAGPVSDEIEAGNALMAAYPDVKTALNAARRAEIAAHYFLLYRELNLTEAQRREFESIMLKSTGSSSRHVRSEGTKKIKLVVRQELTGEQKEHYLRALLGETGYAAFKNYDAAFIPNTQTLMVATALSDSESPLTTEQSRALRELFVRESRRPRTNISEYWNGLRRQAQTFLSESQLIALTAMQRSDELSWAEEAAAKRTPAR